MAKIERKRILKFECSQEEYDRIFNIVNNELSLKMRTRVQVRCSQEEYDFVFELAKERGMKMSSVLREALGLMRVYAEAKRSGAKLCIVDEKKKQMREIILA